MPEEEALSQKSDNAVWALMEFYALGAVFHGFDVMSPDGLWAAVRWWIAGGILGLIGWHWPKVKTWFSPRLAATAAQVATDFRWWIGTAMLFLLVGTFSRFVEERRWPFSLASVPVVTSEAPPKNILPLSKLSLESALEGDFQGTLQHSGDYPIEGTNVTVRIIDFRDPHDGAEFLGAYIPRTPQTFSIVKDILTNHAALLKNLGKGGVSIRASGQEGEESADQVIFTKRIFIYYEGDLSLDQWAELEKFSNSLGIWTIMRGSEYLATEKWLLPNTPPSSH
jgi:hypothetical protein